MIFFEEVAYSLQGCCHTFLLQNSGNSQGPYSPGTEGTEFSVSYTQSKPSDLNKMKES